MCQIGDPQTGGSFFLGSLKSLPKLALRTRISDPPDYRILLVGDGREHACTSLGMLIVRESGCSQR